MTVRVGAAEDIEAVLAIERSSPEAPHWPESEYRKIFVEQDGSVQRRLFVWDNRSGPLLGFAVGMVLDASGEIRGEIENVVVTRAARRRGIGRALCEAVISWCGERGAGEMALEVRASSAGAIRLYHDLGFCRIGERKAYYREPSEHAVLMRRLTG